MRLTLLCVIVALALGQHEAHAYFDPNVGGWLYQLLLPLLIAIAGAWAVLRHKISEFFSACVRRLRGK